MKALSIPLLCLSLMLGPAALAQTELDTAIEDLQQRWAVANYEMRGKPRITALQTLTQDLQNERNSKSKSIGNAKAAGQLYTE